MPVNGAWGESAKSLDVWNWVELTLRSVTSGETGGWGLELEGDAAYCCRIALGCVDKPETVDSRDRYLVFWSRVEEPSSAKKFEPNILNNSSSLLCGGDVDDAYHVRLRNQGIEENYFEVVFIFYDS